MAAPSRQRMDLRLCIAPLLLLAACRDNPETVAIHNPIYPAADEDVTYTLEKIGGTGTVSGVRLYEQVTTIDAVGNPLSTGAETLLQTWSSPPATVTYVSPGYPVNRLVTYRFEVEGGEESYRHRITFATRPYPVANQPAPVYVVGDVDDVFDVVFIPDTDVSDLANFRSHARLMIRESFMDEQTTRLYRRSFNFYINPVRGTATDGDQVSTAGFHVQPSNWSNLSFAEGRVLMHQNDLRDYAWGGMYSTEVQNRGTVLHESGHGLFGLADEYGGGAHWQSADLPNIWNSQAGATSAASGVGKTAADVVQIGTTSWWKVCANQCQMNTTGLTHTFYDKPDQSRILFTIIDNAGN